MVDVFVVLRYTHVACDVSSPLQLTWFWTTRPLCLLVGIGHWHTCTEGIVSISSLSQSRSCLLASGHWNWNRYSQIDRIIQSSEVSIRGKPSYSLSLHRVKNDIATDVTEAYLHTFECRDFFVRFTSRLVRSAMSAPVTNGAVGMEFTENCLEGDRIPVHYM